MLALVHPVLGDRRTGVRRKPFETGGLRRRGRDDGGVVHRTALFQCAAYRGDGSSLLPDGHVYTAHLLLGITGLPVLPLVEDGVDADGGFAGLAVADDQLALAAADRGHRVNRLDPGLQRLLHALPVHHRGRLELQRAPSIGVDVSAPVDRLAERVNHPPQKPVANRNR